MPIAETTLPLRSRSSERWARRVAERPLDVLADQAFLEKKAALNALELLARQPESGGPRDWATFLAGVARDESQHLLQVARLLRARGRTLPRVHHNPYARELRSGVRMGAGVDELVDRLLVAALIEARSCERFERLAAACPDPELARFWSGLHASELGHFRGFLELAEGVAGACAVQGVWEAWLAREAEVLAAQPFGWRVHGGEPAAAEAWEVAGESAP